MPYKDPEQRRAAGRKAAAKWRAKNLERARESYRRWKGSNPEKAKAATVAWRSQNAEHVAQTMATWRASHVEQVVSYQREWLKKNPEKNRRYVRQYRVKRAGAAGTCSDEQLQARIALYGGLCWVPGCGKAYEAIDHVMPLSKGGSNWPSNLRPICKRHNSQKKDRAPAEFLGRAA